MGLKNIYYRRFWIPDKYVNFRGHSLKLGVVCLVQKKSKPADTMAKPMHSVYIELIWFWNLANVRLHHNDAEWRKNTLK